MDSIENKETTVTDQQPETASRSARHAAERKKPVKFPVAIIIVIAAAAIAVGVLSATHDLVWFRHGVHFKNASSIAHKLESGETAKLAYLPALERADFKECSCYQEVYEWAKAHPDVDVRYTVAMPQGTSYDEETRTADYTALDPQTADAASNLFLRYILGLEVVKLDLSKWTVEEMASYAAAYPDWRVIGTKDIGRVSPEEFVSFRQAMPDADIKAQIEVGLTTVPADAESVKFDGSDKGAVKHLAVAAPYMKDLKSVDFGEDTEGHSGLPEIYAFLKENPDLKVDYKFTIFDRTPGIHDIKLDLNHRKMTDQGAEVREVIACMPDLKWLDMDSCGVDDEHMAAIRDDFPDVKVVWRVWFGVRKTYSVRTNALRILASAPENAGSLTPSSAASLKYCTDVKYLDIGHNEYLYNIDFVRYMPNLEVFIVMDGTISDISPLENCPHLEFCELFTNRITDLSPLANAKELKHLNINWNHHLKDITPLYGLDLERLWIGIINEVPKEQIEEFRRLHPNCVVNDYSIDSHEDWRWDKDKNYYPRYALLREQMGYHYPEGGTDYVFYWMDPLYEPHDDSVQDPLCPYN
ncbi:MAG: hypothetical protein II024_03310 [Firmicutes bacterium]|nr:hypothetical protein [Bacillota bacterium]